MAFSQRRVDESRASGGRPTREMYVDPARETSRSIASRRPRAASSTQPRILKCIFCILKCLFTDASVSMLHEISLPPRDARYILGETRLFVCRAACRRRSWPLWRRRASRGGETAPKKRQGRDLRFVNRLVTTVRFQSDLGTIESSHKTRARVLWLSRTLSIVHSSLDTNLTHSQTPNVELRKSLPWSDVGKAPSPRCRRARLFQYLLELGKG